MPSLQKIGIFCIGLILAGMLAYGELVLDWRTPRSEQPVKFALTASTEFLMADYNRLRSVMEQKYGERVLVSVPVSESPGDENGIAKVILDGNIIETHSLKRLSDVYGIFVIDPDDPKPIRFPFMLAPDQYLAGLEHSLVEKLKDHFRKAPQAWFEFSDADWTIDRCSLQKSGLGLGIVGDVLRLQEGTSCVVTWKGKRGRSMLVFVGRADGKAWLRPFSESLCHGITKAALRRLDSEGTGEPDYAACILGDRTTKVAAGKSMFGEVYAVRSDHAIERMHSF